MKTCSSERSTQQAFTYAVESAQLTQVHTCSTREGKLSDLVFTTNLTVVTNSNSVPGISDHDVVVTDFDVSVEHQNKRRRKIYQFAHADWDSLNADFSSLSDEVKTQYASGSNTESLWTTFNNLLIQYVDKHIPSKLSSRRCNLPWLCTKLQRLLKRNKRLNNKAKKTNKWKNY